jgi:exosome complex component RRP41
MHPKHAQNPYEAVVKYRYNMAPFSVDERIRPGRNRRSTEISKVSRQAFESVIIANYFPKTSVDVFVEILQATAGSRVAGITAAAVALANAGIPMKDLLVGCAAGKVDGKIVLDLGKEEDNYGEADLPVVYSPRTGNISMLQMDGNFTQDEFKKALKLAIEGCKKISEMQRTALKEGSYNWKEGETI